MTRILGTSERGKPRILDVHALVGGQTHIRIHHPNGRSGASTSVNVEALRAALRAPAASALATIGPGPLYVDRRGSSAYLWIQNVGQNGWSILVDAASMESVLESGGAGSDQMALIPGLPGGVRAFSIAMLVGLGIVAACVVLK